MSSLRTSGDVTQTYRCSAGLVQSVTHYETEKWLYPVPLLFGKSTPCRNCRMDEQITQHAFSSSNPSLKGYTVQKLQIIIKVEGQDLGQGSPMMDEPTHESK